MSPTSTPVPTAAALTRSLPPDPVTDAHRHASHAAPVGLTPGLQHLYATQLPELCVAWQPARVPRPALQVFNHSLARDLGWPADALDSPQGAELLAGNVVPDGAQPVAQGYAGHQFGGYSPQLGDGRALLLGEVRDAAGQLRDVAFKGSGRTPFSRGGDGKAALGPMLREYLVSEAMHALGIPTTRSLAVATTGELVRRDSGPLPGAVLTRVAASHIRVGTFQWVAAQGDETMLRRLADFTMARHFAGLPPAAYLAMLTGVCERQAALVAQWMGVGFVHGVMNTDNMTLSGETIDYGPCALMEAFDPDTVFSSIDHGGRYAWGNQPGIASWNLARLAETLLPLLHEDSDQAVALASDVINRFQALYQREWLAVMRGKLGLMGGTGPMHGAGGSVGLDGGDGAKGAEVAEVAEVALATDAEDLALIQHWLATLQAQGADWTLAHRYLCDAVGAVPTAVAVAPANVPQPFSATGNPAYLRLAALFADPTGLNDWLPHWHARLLRNPSGRPQDWANAMRRTNPLVIPRNQLVEEALSAASNDGNLAPFHALLAVVQHPFDELPAHARFVQPAHPDQARGYHTFCGT